MRHILKKEPYANCKMIDENNEFICYISNKKRDWYLRQKIALQINPKTIQLLFKPKGNRRGDKYYEQELRNICVICGCNENLTKHHIIPRCFRKCMSLSLKKFSHHDVVLLCINCHEKYERESDKYQTKLCEKFNLPKSGINLLTKISQADTSRLFGLCSSLIKYGNLISENRKLILKQRIAKLVNKEISDEDIKYYFDLQTIKEKPSITYSSIIMNKIKDHKKFIKSWRKHFQNTMQPKYMPEHWNVEKE